MLLKVLPLLATVTFAVVAASDTDTCSRDDFPPNFVFGAATSAYQVLLLLLCYFSPLLVSLCMCVLNFDGICMSNLKG